VFTTAGVPSPCPRRRSRLNTDAKIEPEAFVNQSGKTDQSVAPAKKKGVGAKPKAAHAAQTAKAPQATAAVIAGGVQYGEAGLQILRQR